MTEESVKEVCSGLTSVRANERKKNAETLKDFLSRNAIPSLLTKNTLKKSGYTWNHVFDDINDYIMKVIFHNCICFCTIYLYFQTKVCKSFFTFLRKLKNMKLLKLSKVLLHHFAQVFCICVWHVLTKVIEHILFGMGIYIYFCMYVEEAEGTQW